MSCRKECIGKLDKLISIVGKTKVPADYGNVDAQIETDVLKKVWAKQENLLSRAISSFGILSFDDVNMSSLVTDIFTIRYIDIDLDITFGITYKNIFYKILGIQYEGDNEFLKILTSRKGKETIKPNLV